MNDMNLMNFVMKLRYGGSFAMLYAICYVLREGTSRRNCPHWSQHWLAKTLTVALVVREVRVSLLIGVGSTGSQIMYI